MRGCESALTGEDVYVRGLAPDVGVWGCGDGEGGHDGGLGIRSWLVWMRYECMVTKGMSLERDLELLTTRGSTGIYSNRSILIHVFYVV